MPVITERKIKEAWNRFRPAGQLFAYTEDQPMRVRLPASKPGGDNENTGARQRVIFMDVFLQKSGTNGLPVLKIIGVVPDRDQRVILETIFNCGCSTPDRLCVQL